MDFSNDYVIYEGTKAGLSKKQKNSTKHNLHLYGKLLVHLFKNCFNFNTYESFEEGLTGL